MEFILNNGKKITKAKKGGLYKASYFYKDETILELEDNIYITIQDGNFTVDELPFQEGCTYGDRKSINNKYYSRFNS